MKRNPAYKSKGFVRQNRQRKTSDKFGMDKYHLFLKSVLLVIFVAKSYVLMVNTLDSVVATSDFMGITT
ncbi:hypothetical protein IWX83_003444 [Flavobacterium sp. CG_9.1]|uniref:Uncharacterized protein n=1 Tax=Flavobacterium xanthum TaxID=69322 RepID=A0A1M7JXZ2_9FLAO|nr:hypothetical protein [Flavobacterium sp. CG_9.1]SHM57909.1 hypothetical protein SAMN05443669_104625 [Flavobacterium xanthum]